MKQLIFMVLAVAILQLASACSTVGTAEVSRPTVGSKVEIAIGIRQPPNLQETQEVALGEFSEDDTGDLTARLEDLSFASGSAVISEAGSRDIEVLVEDLTQGGWSGEMCFEGFADGVGAAGANQRLSERRSDAVRQRFAELGFPNADSVGYGEQGAIDGVDDPTRRIVIVALTSCNERG